MHTFLCRSGVGQTGVTHAHLELTASNVALSFATGVANAIAAETAVVFSCQQPELGVTAHAPRDSFIRDPLHIFQLLFGDKHPTGVLLVAA